MTRLTNKRGVDVVIEHVGEATWGRRMRALARGRRLVKQLSILGSYMGTKGELIEAARFLFTGELKPVVDRAFPLAAAALSQQRLEASGQFGKIVLDV